VAADIGGVSTTHINHLTPRVLDIDDLYSSMQARGVAMIDEIQGPPRWEGPDLLLRQTSFRALAEPRVFREPDGRLVQGTLRVRFGEVEARGIAPTPEGRDIVERLTADVDRRLAGDPGRSRQDVAAQVWRESMPASEEDLRRQRLAYFTYAVAVRSNGNDLDGAQRAALRAGGLEQLVDTGVLRADPIVYEDFLPRSAAGIFASNLSGNGRVDAAQGGAPRDIGWMSDVIGQHVRVPEDVYHRESENSLAAAEAELGVVIHR
jgi:uncharacterized glyoxalase superfamily metalloenzyme YdcJ